MGNTINEKGHEREKHGQGVMETQTLFTEAILRNKNMASSTRGDIFEWIC